MVSPRQRTAARLAAAQAARLALFYPPVDDPWPRHEHTRQGAWVQGESLKLLKFNQQSLPMPPIR